MKSSDSEKLVQAVDLKSWSRQWKASQFQQHLFIAERRSSEERILIRQQKLETKMFREADMNPSVNYRVVETRGPAAAGSMRADAQRMQDFLEDMMYSRT